MHEQRASLNFKGIEHFLRLRLLAECSKGPLGCVQPIRERVPHI
jgi:hypothetical protein